MTPIPRTSTRTEVKGKPIPVTIVRVNSVWLSLPAREWSECFFSIDKVCSVKYYKCFNPIYIRTDDGYRSWSLTGYAGGSTRETQSGRGDGETAYGSYKPDLPLHNDDSGPSLFVRGCHQPSKSTFHVSLQVSICPVVHYGGVNAFM